MDILRHNRFWVGVLVAMSFPVMAFGVISLLFDLGTSIGIFDEVADPMGGKRLRTMTLLAFCANIIFIQFYNNRYTQRTLRGVLFVTFLAAVVWFLYFYQDLMAEF